MSTADLLGSYTAKDDMDEDAEGEEEEAAEGAVDLMGNNTGDEDSSEEEDDDSEAEREVRAGFIVDEDEASGRKNKKKRRKHRGDGESSRKRRKDSDDDAGDLDEDDLDLLEENTGQKLGGRNSNSHKLKRLRRRRSASAGSDESDGGNLNNIFDDDREAVDTGGLFDADEMAGFIEDDSDDSEGRHGSDSEDDRAARKRDKKQKKRQGKSHAPRRSGFGASMVEGITQEAWQEVTEVFGNGYDYSYALDDEPEAGEEKALKDIFEPSEIASRMLTEADDAIRAIDIPERMQLASAGIPSLPPTEAGPAPFIADEDIDDAVAWVSTRISARISTVFLAKNHGNSHPLHNEFITALKNTLRFINIEFLEVPFIQSHRADFLVHYEPDRLPEADRETVLLEMSELWTVSTLSVKYRAFANRKQDLRKLFNSLDVEDDYFEDIYNGLESIEEVADANDWLAMKYSARIAEVKAAKDGLEDEGHVRVKRATRESRYENAKRSVVSKFAERIGVSATELSQDFVAVVKAHYSDDPDKMPLVLAEEYSSGEYKTADTVMSTAKMILIHEISRDPMLKKEARRFFKDYCLVSVEPTERGQAKIDEMHPFFAFKYLKDKPIASLYRTTQFLQILSAEAEGLVKSTVFLPPVASLKLLEELKNMYCSDYVSSIAEAWNVVRTEILQEAVTDGLIPAAQHWARNLIIEEEEEFISDQCYKKLGDRINTAPYMRHDETMTKGEIPTVLAVSHGGGDPKRDSVIAVYLDAEGHFREHVKLDRLDDPTFGGDPAHREAFKDLLERRRPQVIVVGGFSPNTKRLMGDIRSIAEEVTNTIFERNEDDFEDDPKLNAQDRSDRRKMRASFETTYVFDDVARIYQNSKRATSEFPELSTLGKYCVALARYVQSPLNEYAALGSDLTALNYHPDQKLLGKDKVSAALEHALMEVTAMVGVDINRAIRNSYYFHLLPYVGGLGPRKASSILQKINGPVGGTLSSRSSLITHQVMTKNIFMNAAAYLRIPQDELNADLKRNTDDEQDKPDVLDDTRIHPEDYEVARKMAADAMEYDEEDTGAFATPSQAVMDVMDDNPAKLDDLSLDDFASELAKILGVPKRLTLYSIRHEMQTPHAEKRNPFVEPTSMERFTMLTGETRSTLERGLILPVRIVRVRADDAVLCRLDSGIDGVIHPEHRTIRGDAAPRPRPGELVQAQVIDIKYDDFEVELSTQEYIIQAGDHDRRRVMPDQFYDISRAEDDKLNQTAAQSKGQGRNRRVIKHPNFHNFNSGEAEEYLTHQPRGDCVIRPSSKEDHLAVTWKVDEGVFQHIAVFEMNKTNEFSIGSPLKIGKKYSYIDLDELIVMHVKQMARKVEEMMAHEKYKGSQEDLKLYLQNFTMANPTASAYGFGLDKSKPGQFVVSFRSSQKHEVQSWPVKVVPGAFSLLGEDHGDVMALCTAFKTAYSNRSNSANARVAGAGGRTPAHPGMGRTPAHLGAKTPINKYGGQTPNAAMLALGRATPAAGRSTPLHIPNPYAGRPQGAYASGTTPMHPSSLGGGQQPMGGQQQSMGMAPPPQGMVPPMGMQGMLPGPVSMGMPPPGMGGPPPPGPYGQPPPAWQGGYQQQQQQQYR